MVRLDEIAARLQTLIDAVADGEYIHSEADDGLVYRVHLSAADAERLLDEPVTTAPADLAYLLEHARQAEAALTAALAEAARLRAALAWYAYEADAVMMYDDSGARATAALTAPAPNAERGQALLLVAEAARDAWAAYNFDGIHGDLPRAMHGLGEALSHEEGTR